MKAFKEKFANYLQEPTRAGFREVLQMHQGETDTLDFKREWPKNLSKVARAVLAIANTGGGCIVFGVEELESGEIQPVGLPALLDKAEIHKGLSNYLPKTLSHEVYDYCYNESEYDKIKGMKFQVAVIESNQIHFPYIAEKEGEGIRRGAIYIRHGTNSDEATYDDLQKLLNKRLETGFSTTHQIELNEHLEQLKLLYAQIPKTVRSRGLSIFGQGISIGFTDPFGRSIEESNPNYPKENYEAFIQNMIERKKKVIMKNLGVLP